MSYRIGIDLGGTKIEAVALPRDGTERFRQRVATPSGNYEATVRAIADLVRAADAALGERASVGVGIPGAISPATGLIKNANSTCLIGRALDKDIAAAVGRPVRLANDADCFTLSEAVDGAAAGASIVFGVILGTGVGGGLVIDKRAISGPNAITGEWGHNPLPWPQDNERPGPTCYCGRRGCIETFLSGPGLARDHGQGWTAEEIAASDDPGARAAMDRYVDRLARGLAHVVNIIDPHVIVLGGGLSRIHRLYDDVPRLLSAGVFSDAVTTKIVPPRHGDSSGVRGAAWLWS
jgi:fructokinase